MPEKVIGGGRAVPRAAEVEVPSWREFNEKIERLWQEFGYVNANKQELWDAVNALKRNPSADIKAEFRTLCDAAFSAKEQIDGPRPEGRWTIWQCIEDHGKRLDAFDKRFEAIRSDAAKAFRGVIEETLHPIFQYGLEQTIREMMSVKEENKTLREELASLRAEVNKLKATSNP
jgi:hypothetical protein